MNKFIVNLFALCTLTSGLVFTSCDDDNDYDGRIKVVFEATPAVDGSFNVAQLAGKKVQFKEIRNTNVTEGTLDKNGVTEVRLTKGTYDVSIEDSLKINSDSTVAVAMRIENLSVNTYGQKVTGKVLSMPKAALGQNFIFSEVFFNGERNSGRMMHPDQYIVVFNPTVGTLYADGLSVAVTQHLAWQDKQMWYDKYYPNKVPVGGFITIPGEGKDHPVGPGERLVIAFTAIDHSKVEGYDHAVDLSGADFEIYYGPDSNDTDNSQVENVLLTENGDSYGFFFQPRGYVSPLLFKLENGKQETIEAFLKENTSRTQHFVPADEEKGTPADTIEINIFSVDTDKIIDGIQTSDVPQDVKTRVIPEVVDRGKFLVNGCHRQELAIRKTYNVNGKTYYKDTNNSSEDFVSLAELKEKNQVQNAFPIGWRNKNK